jgi:signal transduction histidine kinase
MKPRHSTAEPNKPRSGSKAARACIDLGPDERERLRSALHGGLGQLLTSIAFLASSLRDKLSGSQLPEASEADQILLLTRQAISETQALVQEPETTHPMRINP